VTPRKRWKAALEHREPDQVPIHDSPWAETIRRWNREGLPPEIPVEDYFGYEMCSIGFDASPMYEVKTVYKDETYIIETTPYGGVRKNFRTYASTPEIIDWPVKSRYDWDALKERLSPDFTRVDWVSVRNRYQRARSEGKFIAFSGVMGYDYLQSYLYSEQLLMALVEQPDWVREMAGTVAQLIIRMAQMMMEKGYQFDAAFLFDDRAYRNAPLFSPQTYRQVLFEWDKLLCDFFHSHGMPVILHSDGNLWPLIPHLIEAGINCLQPLEVKAGMDVRELKRKYGDQLAFMGGINVIAMYDPDPKVIEEEIRSKFEVAKVGGGYIYHSDHSVPPNVSLVQYERVMELVRKYGEY
jgi:uroporphyrinogen decarboxylase